ncbi:importin-9 [Onthophagus taurus]|uniref:importin-9 n=1 Tax=Onthophagus taurus TaxID=166361 RepID=UPI000C203E06|nr:importin-9 [Onthophagus taurus]
MDLKEALLQTVSCMLSADNDVRRLAEERQKALEVTDDYSLHLAEILLTTDEALEERQMASVLLTKYIKTHWRQGDPFFIEPVVADTIKKKLRSVLPTGLSDNIPKVQNAVASTLATIAVYDFPNVWNDMIAMLTCKLSSQTSNDVVGGLHFLNEFTKVACRGQLILLTPNIYEYLYKVCQNDMCVTSNRSLAISITSMLIHTDYTSNRCREDTTLNAIEYFCDLLITILYQPFSDKVDYCLKAEIYRFLFNVYLYLPNMIKKAVQRLIPVTWEIFNKCQSAYTAAVMDPNALDFSGHHGDLLELICNSLRIFQTAILQVDSGKEFIYKNLPEVLCKFIVFMSVTIEQEMQWFDDEEAFYNDHSGDSIENNVRLYVRKIFTTLVFTVPENHLVPAIDILIARVLEESCAKIENVTYWVRTQESLMYMIQTIYEIYNKDDRTPVGINIKPQLAMWTNLLETNYARDHVFFYVRIVLLGGTLSKYLEREALISHVNVILNSLRTNNNVVRMAGLIALEKHCQEVKRSQRYVQEFTQNLKNIAECVVNAQDLSPRLCYIMLKCIHALIEFDSTSVPDLLEKIVPLLRNYFWKNLSFPGFSDLYFKTISELSKNSLCIGYMQDIMFPEIIKVIVGEPDKCIDVEYQNVALHVIKTIIEHAPVPINQGLIEESFNCMYRIILTSNECLAISCATVCICYCIAKAPNQVCAIRSSSGKTGLDFVMDIIKHILDPGMSTIVCKAAGRVCLATLKYLSNALTPQHFDCIIKSTLTRMNYFKHHFNDGLLIIFVYLFHVHTDTLINTLSVIPGPNGDSALAYILHRWIKANGLFLVKYELRLSLFALSRVMEYALQHNNHQLFNFTIPHKKVFKGFFPETVDVPLLAKILEILSLCVSCIGTENTEETSRANNDNEENAVYEEDNVGVEDYDEPNIEEESFILDPNSDVSLDNMIFEEYIKFDRIDGYIVDFLRTVSQTPTYPTLLKFLNENEKMLLRRAGINVTQ